MPGHCRPVCAAPLTALAVSVLCLAIPRALAQVPPGYVAHYVPNPAFTLAKVWPDLAWDASRRGPLIAIEPPPSMRGMTGPGEWSVPAPPPEKGPDGYTARTLCDYYALKPFTLTTLTTLAPREMVVLNPKPGKPDILRGIPRDHRERLFEASLTPNQWREIGSPRGIGLNDLNRDQQALYLSLLPDPFRIRQYDPAPRAATPTGPPPLPRETEVSPQARAGIRLRLTRDVSFAFPTANRPDGWTSMNGGRLTPDAPVLTIATPGAIVKGAFGAEFTLTRPNQPKPGQLDFAAPALDARISLGPPASAANAPNPAPDAAPTPLTVGDLVRRASAATGVELYADPRAAGLTVLTLGASARAGDVLRALCLGVTGTFRKVGPAFVLTDDVHGIGARRMLLDEWLRDTQAQVSALVRDAEKQADAPEHLRSIGFTDPSDLPLSADRMNGIPPDRSAFPSSPVEVAVADLPAAWQTRLRAEAARVNQREQQSRAHIPPGVNYEGIDSSVRDDRVRISTRLSLTYLVPGVGPVANDLNVGSMSVTFGDNVAAPAAGGKAGAARPAPPSVPPLDAALANYPYRVVLLAPADAKEAARCVSAAKEHGFTQVWIAVPPNDATVLPAAVAAGTEQHITVAAVVSPLRRAEADMPAGMADVDILGETLAERFRRRSESEEWKHNPILKDPLATGHEWLRSGDPAARDVATESILAAARVPGLAGLVVRYSAPPGYRDSASRYGSVMSYNSGAEPELGYTPQMRVAFLRQTGGDPIDIAPDGLGYGSLTDLPYFSDRMFQPHFAQVGGRMVGDEMIGGEMVRKPGPEPLPQRWLRFRYQIAADFLRELYGKLTEARPDLPLLLDDRDDLLRGDGFFTLWDGPNAIPDTVARRNANLGAPPKLRSLAGKQALLRLQPYTRSYRGAPQPPDATPEPADAFARQVAFRLDNEKAMWQGLVVDLSGAPLDRALAQLSGFTAAR